jgi:hypothetical protein
VVLPLAGLPAPVQASSALPPRETPTPPSPDGEKDKDGPPVGAYIELVAPVGAWVVVQWQDSAGSWHDVEGWRGSAANSSRWWVHPKDFGSGPFRWVIYQGNQVSAMSEPFYLPGTANETLQIVAQPKS